MDAKRLRVLWNGPPGMIVIRGIYSLVALILLIAIIIWLLNIAKWIVICEIIIGLGVLIWAINNRKNEIKKIKRHLR